MQGICGNGNVNEKTVKFAYIVRHDEVELTHNLNI
jgi:hypothetical protein